MKNLFAYHLYFIGFLITTLFCVYINWEIPPHFDEARAWNVAKYLNPIEIFSIGKVEGHPFLWYYVLSPIAKLNLFYPHSLYTLNFIIMLLSLYILYKYAPLPTYIKYLITFSAPFLQLYSSFARSYSLTILLLFILLYLHKQRFNKQVLYLTLILLLANTNTTGFFAALPLGMIYLQEQLLTKSLREQKNILITVIFMAIEFIALYIQFLGYDDKALKSTPDSGPLSISINSSYYPANIVLLCIIYLSATCIFIKNKTYDALFFLLFTAIQLTLLLNFIHKGGRHHYYFYYIYLIGAYWIANTKKQLNNHQLLPLSILSILLIFNNNIHYKHSYKEYVHEIKYSALKINKLFNNQKQEIIIFDDFSGNIMLPYLNDNIILLNQTTTEYKKLKAFKEFLIFYYRNINPIDILEKAQKNPQTLLYRTCGEASYINTNMTFNLKYKLNNTYCLYDIVVNSSF